MVKILAIILLFSGCTTTGRTPKYKMGQPVTNGYCSGVISSINESYSRPYTYTYRIMHASCGFVEINYVELREEEITS